jgi:hypothetical protein
MPFAYKLESPNFVPCKARGSELLFIGYGATHYTNAIQETCNEPNSFNAYERSEFRGERIGIGLMGMIGFGVAASTGKRRRIALCVVSLFDSVDFPYRASIGNPTLAKHVTTALPGCSSRVSEITRL